MELHGLTVQEMCVMVPELTLIVSTVLLVLLDLFLPSRFKRTLLGWLALASLSVSACFVIGQLGAQQPIVQLLNGSYRVDDFGSLMKLVLIGGTALIVFMSLGSIKPDEIRNEGELYYLLLPATLGAMIMASSSDLITLFVGLETLSITSYILVGMRKKNPLANEGAFKYLVLGGASSAMILYGMSFLYGMSGSTRISEINQALVQQDPSMSPLIYVSFFLLLAGFGFKIAAAPFHTWVSDVYRGAATPVTAYLAVISKAAAFAILFRVFYGVYFFTQSTSPHMEMLSQDVFWSLEAVAAIAMIVGNTLALREKNFKRLMAYSGIANAGYLLVPISVQFSATHFSNFSEFFYYLVAYLFMNIGAFAVLMIVENASGETDLKGLAGLNHRAPWTASAMVLLILSLAGLPVTGGFFGKLFIMLGAVENHQYWIAAIMIATSVMSFYYYFGIARQMFMRASESTEQTEVTARVPLPLGITVWTCALAGIIMGFYPQMIIGPVQKVFSLVLDLFM